MESNRDAVVNALASEWLAFKKAEVNAALARVEVENKLVQLLEVPSEGSKTQKVGHYKLTVTQPVGRKIDEDAWRSVSHLCPPNLAPVKYRIEPDVPGVKWLIEHEPLVWAKIAPAFETKPGKVGFKVEAL